MTNEQIAELLDACSEMSAMLGQYPANGFYTVNAGCVDNFRECLDRFRKAQLSAKIFSVWECRHCGSRTEADKIPVPAWRWNGASWEHKCEGTGSHANYCEGKMIQ